MSTNRLPGPSGVLATLRVLRGLAADPCPALDACSEKYGATFAVGVGPLRIVVIGDPAHLDAMFSTPSDAFKWGHWANVLGFIVGRTSMIVSDGADHRRRRGRVQPGFARRRLDGWIPMILAETDRAIDETIAVSDSVIDLYPVGKNLVLHIVVKAFFGAGFSDRVDEIGAIFEQLQDYIEQPGARQIPHPLPFTRRARARAAHRQFNRVVDVELARRRAATETHLTDLLDALLESGDAGDSGDSGDSGLSDEEIRDQVGTLIGAGYHTTAASLAWALQRALATPAMWARLRAEADAVLDNDAIGPETLQRLTDASAVVHEALRLHPAGVFSPRQAVRDVTIGAFTIPNRAMILWSPYLAGRDPSIWVNPLEFDPDRHIQPAPATVSAMESAWVPFGRGPRRCIGFALAQMELTLIISRLAQRLDLTLETDATPSPYGTVVNRPRGGVRVTANARA